MAKFYTEKENGKTICVDVRGGIDEYAKAFLTIWNNAREFPDTIAKVENCHDNRIFVTVYEKAEARAVEWLEQFGKIKRVEACDIFTICAEYPDNQKYYNENKDGEPVFIVEI